MSRLYKRIEGTLHYWEAWSHQGQIVIHTGAVSSTGKTTTLPLARRKDGEATIDKLAKPQLKSGFGTIPLERHWTLTIQQDLAPEWEAKQTLDRRYAMEDGLNEVIGWIGAGILDGGDIGHDRMNVFLLVLEPQLVLPAVVDWLRQAGHLGGTIIALTSPEDSEETTVVWPEGHTGEFTP